MSIFYLGDGIIIVMILLMVNFIGECHAGSTSLGPSQNVTLHKALILSTPMSQKTYTPSLQLPSEGDQCSSVSVSKDERVAVWNKYCIVFVGTHRKFSASQKHCEDKGGSLVEILDDVTQRFIEKKLKEYSLQDTDTWIGLRWKGATGEPRWLSGKAVNFTHWGHGSPDWVGRCTAIHNKELKWNNEVCERSKNSQQSICQIARRVPKTSTEEGTRGTNIPSTQALVSEEISQSTDMSTVSSTPPYTKMDSKTTDIPRQVTQASTDHNIAVYASGGAGGAVLLVLLVAITCIVYRQRHKLKPDDNKNIYVNMASRDTALENLDSHRSANGTAILQETYTEMGASPNGYEVIWQEKESKSNHQCLDIYSNSEPRQTYVEMDTKHHDVYDHAFLSDGQPTQTAGETYDRANFDFPSAFDGVYDVSATLTPQNGAGDKTPVSYYYDHVIP